ncbi:MAG TPA: hypothetical protein VF395_20915, partial [Polyangiaceae bacterium]
MPLNIPHPTIYLRNKFSIRPGLNGPFFQGQKDLLEHMREVEPDLRLIAACGTGPLIRGKPVTAKSPKMMHIWCLPEWDSLYSMMYRFSETDWYAREVSSLKIEHQDMLIATGHLPVSPRPKWQNEECPGYIYLYEEIRIDASVTKLSYLRELNWFAAQVKDRGWNLVWVSAEITGTPSQVCILWRAPSKDVIAEALRDMEYTEPHATRFVR